jgi:guanylate kinase
MDNQEGILIVISGPSGSGKGTVLNSLLAKSENLYFSISATTRSPRKGEVHGKQYFFITKSEFIVLADKNQMLEHTEYCGNLYGTPKQAVEDRLKQGENVLLEIEVDGNAQIRQNVPQSVSIFILPPSFKVLEQRLRNRATDSEQALEKRLKRAKNELEQAMNYDYIVINDDIDKCVGKVVKIIESEKYKSSRMKNALKEVIEND